MHCGETIGPNKIQSKASSQTVVPGGTNWVPHKASGRGDVWACTQYKVPGSLSPNPPRISKNPLLFFSNSRAYRVTLLKHWNFQVSGTESYSDLHSAGSWAQSSGDTAQVLHWGRARSQSPSCSHRLDLECSHCQCLCVKGLVLSLALALLALSLSLSLPPPSFLPYVLR
jgi:hypothetical protein